MGAAGRALHARPVTQPDGLPSAAAGGGLSSVGTRAGTHHGPTDHLYRLYLDRVQGAEGVIWRRVARGYHRRTAQS